MVLGRPLLQALFVLLLFAAATIRIVQVYYLGSDVLPKAPRLTSPQADRGTLNGREVLHTRERSLLIEFSVSGPLRRH